ncbi:hypothetical protein VQ042_11455 [Aurantimonas sp. A2-1-M11]
MLGRGQDRSDDAILLPASVNSADWLGHAVTGQQDEAIKIILAARRR